MRITFEEIPGRGSGRPFEAQELMAVVMARALKNGELAGTGAGSAVARAACRLAQASHAPDLNFIAGGSGAVNPFLNPLTASSCDFANLDCEAVLPLFDVIAGVSGGRMDVFFYGGLQVDRYGNVNLSRVGGSQANPVLRGPGAVALPLVAAAGRGIIFMSEHSPRSFVEKVDFITAPGFLEGGLSWCKAHRDGRLAGQGPVLVVSPLAVLDFEEATKAMRLVSSHPGVSVEDIQAATGFELIIPPDVPATEPPSPAELRFLREMDANRLLRS